MLTLIIESNEELRSLYALNLRTWVGSESIGIKFAAQFDAIIETNPDVKLIIVKARCQDEQSAEEVHQKLKARDLNIPVIVLGQSTISPSDQAVQIHIDTGLDIKSLIQKSAKFLGVTAQSMAKLAVGEFFDISIEHFKRLNHTNVDIFEKGSPGFDQVFKADYDFDQEEIKSRILTGVSRLYVKSKDRLKFVSYASDELASQIPLTEINDNDLIKVQEMSSTILKEKLKKVGITKDTVELSRRSMKMMVSSCRRNKTMGSLIKNLMKNKAGYLFKHTQVLAYVCQHIVEHVDWGNDEQKGKLVFISFFHDIVLETDKQAMIHTEEALKASDISVEEKELVNKHAQMSAEVVSKYPSMPMGADVIIRQHHGVPHGIGFAKNYGGNLSPITIVFILAEDFTDGILRSGEEKIDVPKKIAEMRERFPSARFQKIIDLLENISV